MRILFEQVRDGFLQDPHAVAVDDTNAIYLGEVKQWNDPAIRRLNPGVRLPATAITPVFRSDGSGDTYALSDYLSKVSTVWKRTRGVAS